MEHKHTTVWIAFSILLASIGCYVAMYVTQPNLEVAAHVLPATSVQSVIDFTPPNPLLYLVDKQHSIGSYTPTDLVQVTGFPRFLLREEAEQAWQDMRVAALSEGIYLKVISAYRSHQTQAELFDYYASIYGEEKASTFSAYPEHSEHQLGTTLDFGVNPAVDFTNDFADTTQGIWLQQNAATFGFVMSYPLGKEDETGYIYEPWHYRYIGVDEAQKFMESGMTLNNYLKYREF